MGTYLDYSIEFLPKEFVKNKKFFFVVKADYEDTDIVSPYVLKHIFADFLENCPGKIRYVDKDIAANLTKETLHIFSTKIYRAERSVFTTVRINPKDSSYPYKYTPEYHIDFYERHANIKEILIRVLQSFSENLYQSRRDTLVGVDLKSLEKNIEQVSPYLVPEALGKDHFLEALKTKSLKELVEANQIENLKRINNEYFLLLNTPFEALHYLKDYNIFSKIEPEELFTGSVGQIHYVDVNENSIKEVPQFALPSELNYFELADIKDLSKYLKKKLSDMRKSITVDNLVKNRIKTVLDEHPEDSNTGIYKSLEKYVENLEIVYCEDLIEETEYQFEEVKKLYNFMKKLPGESRIIWRIF